MEFRKISSFIDLEKTGAEKEQLLQQVRDIVKQLQSVGQIEFKINGTGATKEAAKGIDDLRKGQDVLTLSVKEYEKQLATLAQAQARLNVLESDAAKEVTAAKVATQQRNQELKTQVQLDQAAEGSIMQLRAQLKGLQADYDKMGAAERNGAAGGIMIKAIKDTDAQLKALEASTGRFQRNVGNYASAFTGAFNVLKVELADVKQKLQDPNLTGQQLQKLQKEEALLTQLTENLGKSFSSTRMESRAFQEAAKQMGVQMGMESEEFIAFSEAIGHSQNELDDIKTALKFQASDTKFLDGAIAAVNGLAGAYSAAQGASELFGDGSEDLQKRMVKLQALLAVVNGLQAVQNAIQTESGAVQTALAAKIAVVNAAKSIEAALFTRTAVAVEAESAAQVENAAATELAAGAAETEAVAAGEAAVATTALQVVLSAGIIGLIAALAFGVYELFKKSMEWITAGKLTEEQIKAIAANTKDLNDLLMAQASLFESSQSGMMKYYQKQLAFSQAAGQDALTQFALKKQLAKEEASLAKDQIDMLDATVQKQAERKSQIDHLNNSLEELYSQQQKLLTKPGKNKEEIETNSKVIDIFKAQMDAVKGVYDAGEAARNKSYAAQQSLGQAEIEEAKFNADERRKLILETARLEGDATQNKNALVLADDKSTEGARLAALRQNAEARRRVIEAEKNDVLSNPGSSATDKSLAIKKAAEQEIQVTQQSQEEIRKVKETYRLRNDAAEKQILQSALAQDIDVEKKISENRVFSMDQRLAALKKYAEDQKQLLDADYKLRLQNAGLSEEEIRGIMAGKDVRVKSSKLTHQELLAVEKEYENQVLTLSVDTNGQAVAIAKSSLEEEIRLHQQAIAKIALAYAEGQAKRSGQYAGDVIQLNNALKDGAVTYEKYQIQRASIDRKYLLQSDQDTVKMLQEQLAAYQDTATEEIKARQRVKDARDKLDHSTTDESRLTAANELQNARDLLQAAEDNTQKKIDLEKQLADATKKLSDDSTAKTIENKAKEVAAIQKLEAQAFDTIQAIGDSIFESKKQQVQYQEDQIDKQSEKEIQAAQNSMLTEQQKAATITNIQARQAAQKEALDRRQRQLDAQKAQFDRALDVAKIISETARGVMSALAQDPPNPLLAGIIGVTGALQLAKTLATPIPKYADGTNGRPHPGGLALVGDGGKRELVVDGGQVWTTPDKPTYAWLSKGAEVYPDAANLPATVSRTLAPAFQRPNKSGGQALAQLLIAENKKTREAILSKRENHYTFNADGSLAGFTTKEGHNTTTYLNQNLQF